MIPAASPSSAEPSSIEAAAKGTRRVHWPRIFGYDFFVSFKLGLPPIGAQSYSSDLARRLRERDFTVFFSEEEAPPGENLDGTLVRALRRSRVLVVVVNEGALVHSTWVRKEVEEFRRMHSRRPIIPIVVDRAIDKFGSPADASKWLHHDGRIWLDETTEALQQGIASTVVLERLAVSHRFIRANTFFRWAVASIMLLLIGLTSWAAYEAWDARLRFRQATALRLAAEGAAMTAAERPGGSIRGLLLVLAAGRIVPSASADEALQGEFLKLNRQIAIRESSHPITSLAFSPDGRSIVSGSHDGYVQFWDARTGEPAGDALPGRGPITTIAFAPDAGRIVSGTPLGLLQQWDVTSRKSVLVDPSLQPPLFTWCVAVSPDGSRFAVGLEMGDVVLWNPAEGKPIGHLAAKGVIGGVLSLSFSPDVRRIAYYTGTGNVGVIDTMASLAGADRFAWNVDTRPRSQGFTPMNNFGVSSGTVAFSPDGTRIVSGNTDGSLQWWDATDGRSLSGPVGAHEGGVTTLAFSPDGKLLVSGGIDRRVKIWSTDTPVVLNAGEVAHTAPVTTVAFSPDSQRLVSASLDGTLRIWDASAAKPLGRVVPYPEDAVRAVAFGPDGEPLVTGAEIRNMGEQRSKAFALSPGGSRHVVRVGKYELWLVDSTTGKTITLLANNKGPVRNMMFSPNGVLIASVGDDGLVLLWDARTGRQLPSLHADPPGVSSIAISADGARIATGGRKAIRLWSATSGRPFRDAIQAHEDIVDGLAFSPDGKRLVSGSRDRTLKIWDVATGTLVVGPMLGHEAGVRSVAFSPDGTRIVSGGGIPHAPANEQPRLDYSLRLWDGVTGRQIGRPLLGHQHDVETVAFSRDGKRVVSASLDHDMRVWDVLGAWTDALCGKLPRNPTVAEWREWISPDIDYVCPCPGPGTEPACGGANAKDADHK